MAEATGAVALTVDVARAEDAKRMVDAAYERFGALDILVNNAGIGHLPQPLESLAEDDFDRIVAVNMKAIYLAARETAPRRKGGGPRRDPQHGEHGWRGPRPKLAWYNASKGWVITATRAMAVELAPFGIRVVALNPVAGGRRCPTTFMGGDTPRRARSFSPPSRSGASRGRRISATPPASCAATRPR